MNNLDLKKYANKVRRGIVTEVYSAQAGHPGGSLSAADLFTYLFFEEMNIDPKNPWDPDRDRFVLSKGHTCPGLYAAIALRGYFPLEELKTFRHLGSRLQGHPSMQYLPGLDMSSGSLGQGISAACGMALAGKIDHKSYRVYTLLGDGELEEGEVWEAAMLAGNHHLNNLCVIVDNNNLQIDGRIDDVNSPKPIDQKFIAFNFQVMKINGNDFDDIRQAFRQARTNENVPTCIIASTIKGKGISYMENQVKWHGKAPDDEQYQIAMSDLDKIDRELEKEG